MTTYADVVVSVLADAGIEYIFGVPGSLSSVELIEAAAKRDIRYILCSNESSAAAMAGVYGILRNRPGVVSTGVGPGAAAVLHGVAHLMLERAPVLVLTDRYGDAEFRRLPRQRLEQDQMFRPLTKGSFKIATDNAAVVIRRSLDLAMAGRPGPVHVDLPYDVMLAEATEAAPSPPPVRQRYAASVDRASAGIAALADRIEGARRPAVIVGQQVSRRGTGAEDGFRRLVEKLGAPVFASVGAKGTLEEDHPLYAGTFRGIASERALLDQSDLVLLVGFEAVEIFTPGIWHYAAPVVSIDEAPYTEGPYSLDLEVIADLDSGLDALAAAVTARVRWNREDIEAYRRSREPALHPTGDGLMPGAVIRIARERLPADGFMAVDAGQHKVLTCDLWETRRRRGFLSSSGLGTMAVSIPAAIAAKLCEPDSPSLCLVGDGGFLMRAGDLETAVREQLPVVIIVFNDRTLNLIKLQQDRRGAQRLGTSFGECDFAAIARGFGFEAERVDSEAGLDSALQRAFVSGKPWLIDAAINPEGYV